ncbi:hypothetical protein GCM10027285_29440 [Oleiagrimonas citrea]
MLTAFWFNTSSGLGFGVTAESQAVAEGLLRKHGYPPRGAEITGVIAGIEFAALDKRHVVPNAGPIVVKGVWYPRHNI